MRRLSALLIAATAGLAAAPLAAADYRLLRIDEAYVKWDTPRFGVRAEVTYGFAARDEHFADAINCRKLAPIAAMAPAWRGDPRRLERVATAAFAMWSRAADITFRPAAGGEMPDILIGAQGEPEGIAFANVWHGTAEAGVAPLTRATICFNPELTWTTEDGPSPEDVLDLATVMAHEIGHAIGLDHPGARGALMGFSNQGAIDVLMPGDVAGAIALYGPPGD